MWTREKKVSGSFEFFMWSPNPLDKLHTRCVYVKCCVYLKRNQSSSTWASLRCMLKTFQISPLFSHWRKFLFSVDATIASIITSTGRRTHEKSMRISRMFKQRSRRRQRQPNSSCGAFSGPTTNYTLVDNQTSVLELGENHIQNAWWSNLVFKWSSSRETKSSQFAPQRSTTFFPLCRSPALRSYEKNVYDSVFLLRQHQPTWKPEPSVDEKQVVC